MVLHFSSHKMTEIIFSERKCTPDLLLKPDDKEEINFYTLLEYTAFLDIQETSYKIINLPKPKQKSLTDLTYLNLQNYLSIDDDGISELCLDLRERVRKGLTGTSQTYNEAANQTDLHVEPHILEDENVASVVADCAVQTVPVPKTTASSSNKHHFMRAKK